MQRLHRLGRGDDLSILLRRGGRLSHALFLVVWRPNNLPGSRFAFIVPLAVDKRAVVRNRLRRRMYEYLRARAARLSPSIDIAITCRRPASAAPRALLYAVLEELVEYLEKD